MQESDGVLTGVAGTSKVVATLEIDPGVPVSVMRSVAVTNGDVPIEWTEEYARPDAYRYVMRRVAEGPLLELGGAIGHAAAETS